MCPQQPCVSMLQHLYGIYQCQTGSRSFCWLPSFNLVQSDRPNCRGHGWVINLCSLMQVQCQLCRNTPTNLCRPTHIFTFFPDHALHVLRVTLKHPNNVCREISVLFLFYSTTLQPVLPPWAYSQSEQHISLHRSTEGLVACSKIPNRPLWNTALWL